MDPPVSPEPAFAEPSASARHRPRVPSAALSIVGGLILWEVLVQVLASTSVFLAPPSEILQDLYEIVSTGYLSPHFWASMKGFLGGMGIAVLLGIPAGLAMGMSRALRRMFEPWLNALYSTPAIALAPLFVLWLGFGVAKTVGVVVILAIFPIVMNTMDGVLRIDSELRDVGLAFGANSAETVMRILLPGSTGYILTSVRLAIGRAVVGVVVADLFGASRGLGFMILEAARVFNAARIFSGTLVLAAIGVTSAGLVRLAERRWAHWLET